MNEKNQPETPNPYRPPESESKERSPIGHSDGTVDAVVGHFRALLSRGGTTLFQLWVIISLLSLPPLLFGGVMQYVMGVEAPTFETMFDPEATMAQPTPPDETTLLLLAGVPIIFLCMLLSYVFIFSSMRWMRSLILEPEHRLSIDQALPELVDNFFPLVGSLLAYSLVVLLGTFCCVLPGLIVGLIFMPVPYLVGVLGFSISDAFSESFTWFKQYWTLFLFVVAVSFALGFAGGMVSPLGSVLFGELLGRPALLVSPFFQWVVTVAISYFTWLFFGATFITIERSPRRRV